MIFIQNKKQQKILECFTNIGYMLNIRIKNFNIIKNIGLYIIFNICPVEGDKIDYVFWHQFIRCITKYLMKKHIIIIDIHKYDDNQIIIEIAEKISKNFA